MQIVAWLNSAPFHPFEYSLSFRSKETNDETTQRFDDSRFCRLTFLSTNVFDDCRFRRLVFLSIINYVEFHFVDSHFCRFAESLFVDVIKRLVRSNIFIENQFRWSVQDFILNTLTYSFFISQSSMFLMIPSLIVSLSVQIEQYNKANY